MRELTRQQNKKTVEIRMNGEIYRIQNPYREDAHELGYKLEEQMYNSIRDCDTDVCDIASDLRFKADNIHKVKDHARSICFFRRGIRI